MHVLKAYVSIRRKKKQLNRDDTDGLHRLLMEEGEGEGGGEDRVVTGRESLP